MKTSSSAFVLGLFFVLSAVFAGGQNCSHGTMNGGAITGYMPCNAEQGHIWTYNQTKSFVDTCTNTQTGVAYDGIPSSVTSAGQCLYEAELLDCPVFFANNETDGTGPGDYNRFYNQAYPQTILPVGGYLSCVRGSTMVQDFEQCACQGCTGGGGGNSCSSPCPCSQATGTFSPDTTECCCDDSPIIVDTTGHGFRLTSNDSGVVFDIRGDGHPAKMSWTAADSGNAFLALDRNGNGKIDSGKELFGNFTAQPASADPNGYLALAEFDKPENGGNGDGIIDYHDAVYSKLLLWIDANHDGISQPNELHTLPGLGVYSISLKYREEPLTDRYGNRFRYRGVLNPNPLDGTSRDGRYTYDVFFVGQVWEQKQTARRRRAMFYRSKR